MKTYTSQNIPKKKFERKRKRQTDGQEGRKKGRQEGRKEARKEEIYNAFCLWKEKKP